ncbi:hypothetical protein [Faecalibacillus intestinalis]
MAANAPWFMQDVPTIFVSLANPYHLFDVPMIKLILIVIQTMIKHYKF